MAGKTATAQRLMSENLIDLFLRQANTRTRFRDPLGADVRWARQHGLGLLAFAIFLSENAVMLGA
jgi:hypothetical protein